MRNVLNGVCWFVLISGALFAVAAQVDDTKSEPPATHSTAGAIEGHPDDCLACKYRGPVLPEEIGDETVWLKTSETGASAAAR